MHTTMAMGTSLLRPSARLDAPKAVTKRISSVAYAVDDSASEENTASAMALESRCSSIWVVASGRPTNNRFNAPSIDCTSPGGSLSSCAAGAHDLRLSVGSERECRDLVLIGHRHGGT